MRGIRVILLLGVLILLLVVTQSASAQQDYVNLVIELINGLRSEQGLPAYLADTTLSELAQAHAEYMGTSGLITHTGPDGLQPRDRVIASGYSDGSGLVVHENIYQGTNATPQIAFDWWFNDAIQYDGMILTSATWIGVGVYTNTNGVVSYTAIFASEPTGTPADQEEVPAGDATDTVDEGNADDQPATDEPDEIVDASNGNEPEQIDIDSSQGADWQVDEESAAGDESDGQDVPAAQGVGWLILLVVIYGAGMFGAGFFLGRRLG
nr:hypothetical protein [Anaerolineae bacterium]